MREVSGLFPTAAVAVAAFALGANGVRAAPVEFDTEAAHVIVVRPVDSWSWDQSRAEETLDVVRSKKANYWVSTAKYASLNGGPVLWHSMSEDPLTNAVKERLGSLGFQVARTEDYRFRVEMPIEVAPSEFEVLRAHEEELLQDVVFEMGDPSTLQARVTHHKVVGTLVSLATLGLVAKLGGGTAAGGVVNSGIVGDIYQVNQVDDVPVAARLPDLDATSFSRIETRRLAFFGGMVGQIVIAYREAKTPENELEALSRAIVSATGADTTPEAIGAARAEDLAWRQAQWDACVAAQKCEGEKP